MKLDCKSTLMTPLDIKQEMRYYCKIRFIMYVIISMTLFLSLYIFFKNEEISFNKKELLEVISLIGLSIGISLSTALLQTYCNFSTSLKEMQTMKNK